MSANPGLPIQFYRAADGADCTNGGVSASHDRAVVVGMVGLGLDDDPASKVRLSRLPADMRIRLASDQEPALWLFGRKIGGDTTWCLIPAGADDASEDDIRSHLSGLMAGGNFGYTCDSRWSRLTRSYAPVAVHDRREW